MGILRVLDKTGDTVVEWDVDEAETTEKARQIFENGMRDRRTAYRIDSPTDGEVIKKFDPNAKEIVMAVPLVGG